MGTGVLNSGRLTSGGSQTDVQTVIVMDLLGGPQPIARLALSCREMLEQLKDPRSGQLRVSTASFRAAQPALLALGVGDDCRQLSLDRLRTLHLDVLEESGHLPQRLADRLLSSLGGALTAAKRTAALPLEELSLRLASFADHAEPLRPSADARSALILGLESLPLRRLQLSFLPLRQKDVLEKVEDASGGRSLTFTTMLKGLCHLEHLVLTHNGMFGDVAMELAKAVQQLNLRTADFSRNRISVEVWKKVAAALGSSVKLQGYESQTSTC
ncbi:unnamed protein product [Symbiodinium natans]|uniref:Uncharacterized protein n=1 Tax=Symbiodinium natans TaxID=878477 RepID=A0A812I5M2_9DINO|nr:unnamed protein product [Symbiodinium natans]